MRPILKKIFGVLFTCAILAVTFFSATALAQGNITLVVNGVPVQTDAPPFIQDGRTLVPIRAIAEALDFYVNWLPETQEIILMGEITVFLAVGDTTAGIWQGAGFEIEEVEIDVPPAIVDGRTFVPVRFIAESFGVSVEWDGDTRTVFVGERSVQLLTFYSQFPGIPSFGYFAGVDQLRMIESSEQDGLIIFRYPYPSTGNVADVFSRYSNLLTDSGIELRGDYSGLEDDWFIRRVVHMDRENRLWVNVVHSRYSDIDIIIEPFMQVAQVPIQQQEQNQPNQPPETRNPGSEWVGLSFGLTGTDFAARGLAEGWVIYRYGRFWIHENHVPRGENVVIIRDVSE